LQKIINIAPFLILARILLPKDYGVISIVFMFTSVLSRFATPGFGSALLQREGDVEEYIDVVWTYDLMKSFAIALVIFFLGGWGAEFFHVAPEYVMIVRLSGVLPLITSLSNPRQCIFKNLEFKKIFIRDLVGQAVYVVVALIIALFISATAWALFLGHLALYISGAIITYILLPSMPRLSFKFSKLRDLMGYGKWIYGQQVLDYLLGFLDNILVGRMLGQSALGTYSRARDLPTIVSYRC
jgi:O-antigen/teichoic acid export membrane protein